LRDYQHHGQLVPWLWPPAGIRADHWHRSFATASVTNDPPLRREAAGVVSCFS
jgi:hypothetical protein